MQWLVQIWACSVPWWLLILFRRLLIEMPDSLLQIVRLANFAFEDRTIRCLVRWGSACNAFDILSSASHQQSSTSWTCPSQQIGLRFPDKKSGSEFIRPSSPYLHLPWRLQRDCPTVRKIWGWPYLARLLREFQTPSKSRLFDERTWKAWKSELLEVWATFDVISPWQRSFLRLWGLLKWSKAFDIL